MTQIFASLAGSMSALANRNLRYYLSGQSISVVGRMMQMTAQSWVVWELSGSTIALGVVAMLDFMPAFFLGPIVGSLADRWDRKRLLLGAQIASMLLAFVLAFLVQTALVQLWHVFLLALLLGIVNAFAMVAQQAFIGEVVGDALLQKGVNLNSTAMQLGRTVGPALGGWLIGISGAASAFWLNGLLFLPVIGTLLLVRPAHSPNGARRGAGGDFREALRFLRSATPVQDMLLLSIVITFFGMPTIQILPAFATNVLHGGPETLGILMASSGIGALAGTLFLAPLAQDSRRVPLAMAAAGLVVGVGTMLFAFSTWLPAAVFFMIVASAGVSVVLSTSLGRTQLLAPPQMRGRMVTLHMMTNLGAQPIAAMLMGFAAAQFGVQTALGVAGVLIVLTLGLLVAVRSSLRESTGAPELAPAGKLAA